MGALQRTKGKVWERKIASDLRSVLPSATIRRSIQSHAAFEPDVVIEGDCPVLARNFWLECTDAKKPDISAKLEQARRDSAAAGGSKLPMVVWKKTGSRSTFASMDLFVLGKLLGFATSPPSESAMVTISWAEVLGAFRRAQDVKEKMGAVSEKIASTPRGVRTLANIAQDLLAACRQPPRILGNAAADCHPPPHVSKLVPQLTYVPTPPGFPDHRTICNQRWEVKYASDLVSNQEAYGITIPLARLIVLDSTQSEESMGHVFTHEVLHGCHATSGSRELDHEQEEDAIRAVCTPLYSMLGFGWWNKVAA